MKKFLIIYFLAIAAAFGQGTKPPTNTLSSLTDVTITSPTTGQSLFWNSSTSKWNNGPVPAPTLSSLPDVNVASPTSNQVLKWNGTAWANYGPLAFTDVTGTVSPAQLQSSSGTASSSTVYHGDGTWSAPTTTAPGSNGTIMKSNGTAWVASTETYAVPGTTGNVMTSDGTNWLSSTPVSGGTVTSITATAPIVVTPSPLTATGVFSLNVGIDHAFTASQSITMNNASTNVVINGLTVTENSTGTAANGLGTGIVFQAESSTTNSVPQAQIQSAWSTVTHASRTAYLDFLVENNGFLGPQSAMRLYGDNGLSIGNTTDPGAGILAANTGYRIGTAASTSGKILKSDGTKFSASTETYAAPGTSGNVMTSDGTNWTSQTQTLVLTSSSSAGLAACCTANTIIPGSTITVPTAGIWASSGQYHCEFDMLKTSAGVGSIVISVHMGTTGTTSDPVVATITYAAGTAAADLGYFDLYANFKSVGSGTSAVLVVASRHVKSAAVGTGLSTIAVATPTTSTGFNSTTQTKISIGFNGSTSFSGTNTFTQTQYKQ